MTAVPDLPQLSPSALNRFLGCEQRTFLDILERRGELAEERRPPAMALLLEQGARHEDTVVAGLREEGRDLVSLALPGCTPRERADATLEAMRAGREVIHQACLISPDGWFGYPDFLVRVDAPSDLGAWSYEVHDAKLGRHGEPAHVFQLLAYTDELERLQGLRPLRMHLLLGDGSQPAFDPADFGAYVTRVRDEFADRHRELADGGATPAYPYPLAACGFCHWWHVCERRRRDDDHISLVAGLQRGQGLKLEAAGVSAVTELAALAPGFPVPRLAATTVATLRAQAALQVRSRDLPRPAFELLEPAHDRGLGRLPAPSAGDVHFDFEGDPYWGDDGLEYLFGSLHGDGDGWVYSPRWATSRAEEKHALETWMDWITERLERHPGLHVFHYNSYEPTALKRLVARHATREHQLDELLRRKVFVDLYGVVRQAIRAGTEGYGLKALEPVFGFERSDESGDAVGSMRRWQAFRSTGDGAQLDGIAAYNEDDCQSTRALLEWLIARRPEAEAQFGVELDALAPEPPTEPTPQAAARLARTEAMRPRLLAGLPDDESEDTSEQRARRVAFALLGYHAREAKPTCWALFDRRTRSLDELRDDDREAISGLEVVDRRRDARSWEWTMRFPRQEHNLAPGGVDEPPAARSATLVAVDEAACTLVVRRGAGSGEEPPRALGPGWPLQTEAQFDSLHAFADVVAARGVETPLAGLDLLRARAPRLRPGTPPLVAGAVDLERLKRQVRGLDRSALVIQGPPGTGKTYTGARLALDLMERGLRVGVTATAHKAINNFLAALEEAADAAGTTFRGWKKASAPEKDYTSDRVSCSKTVPPDADVRLIAGTAWLWSDAEMAGAVDVLFVDEAGQVSLADAIAVSRGARSIVLLGDPQQLPHVTQGTHPLGSGVSVLEHLLGEDNTVRPDRGVLLDRTWRMHPDVCRFVSCAMYDGRLEPVPGCERQTVDSPGLRGSGLRFIGVEHEDNRGRSTEEAAVVADHVSRLLAGGAWTDRDGVRHRLSLADILIVTPYNAQVRCLRATPGLEGARIGTLDKFQGQQAPVVLFSMATSSGEDVSRGLDFLFSANRLNVAVSRAQALATIVCSPRLLSARATTIEGMRLVNALCRFADAAETV